MSNYVQFYCQCWLARGRSRQMAWIPEKFAVADRFLRLTDAGVSEDGWQVVGVGARLTAAYLNERSQDYKHTRRASDA